MNFYFFYFLGLWSVEVCFACFCSYRSGASLASIWAHIWPAIVSSFFRSLAKISFSCKENEGFLMLHSSLFVIFRYRFSKFDFFGLRIEILRIKVLDFNFFCEILPIKVLDATAFFLVFAQGFSRKIAIVVLNFNMLFFHHVTCLSLYMFVPSCV